MKTLSENIPDELRLLQRWVGRDKNVAEKLGIAPKTPLSVFKMTPASVSNPNTWGTFDQAVECLEKGIYENIGFVFADDGIVGIDIDHAFDEDGLPDEAALEVIHSCHSYTEITQSGKGFHIICKGDLPFSGRNNGQGWEIYKEKRYFVLTGRTVVYNAIENATEGIQMVLERHFKDLVDNDSNSKSQRLWMPFCSVSDTSISVSYPEVSEGNRHLSMVSYCGQLHAAGADTSVVLKCAIEANKQYLNPPLSKPEIINIVKSVSKYRR